MPLKSSTIASNLLPRFFFSESHWSHQLQYWMLSPQRTFVQSSFYSHAQWSRNICEVKFELLKSRCYTSLLFWETSTIFSFTKAREWEVGWRLSKRKDGSIPWFHRSFLFLGTYKIIKNCVWNLSVNKNATLK